MKSKSLLYFILALTLLIGSHETVSSFGLVKSYMMERSEEVPSKESEEHTLNVSAREARISVLKSKSNIFFPFEFDSGFQKVVTDHTFILRSSLHILFRSLRH